MDLLVGTSGYSYKEWKGTFYPEKLAAKDMLAYYAERLPTVEINNTFYRLPKTETLETWASQVPETFRFSVKASRRITHLKRLKEADDETGYLLNALQALGPKLGVVFFQLPPNLKFDADRFDAFLDLLPPAGPIAFEFRHESWFDDAVYDRLRDRSFVLCQADTEEAPIGEIISTADWGYLRLRRQDYTEADLASWAERIAAQPWSRAFTFFKHEDEAAGPAFAEKLLALSTK